MAIPQHLTPVGDLKTYRPAVQLEGVFIAGFDWTLYCTGTFRRLPQGEHEAEILLKRFVRQLAAAMQYKQPSMAYYAALEDRYPGIGGIAPIRRHWHFLLACPDHPLVVSVAKQLWMSNGWSTISRYDPKKAGTYYVCKLVGDGAIPYEYNLDKLAYGGPADLTGAIAASRYVPKRLRSKDDGNYLVARSGISPQGNLAHS